MIYTIFDMESNGLLDDVTKIHCLCYAKYDGKSLIEKGSMTSYDDMRSFFDNQEVVIGHNIIKYDLPVFNKLLGIEYKGRAIDSLGISWYLEPKRLRHGLEEWGEELGIKKPVVTDWQSLSPEDYIYRCEQDVEINILLYHQQMDYLEELYEGEYERILNYITYKLECAAEQEQMKWRLDIPLCKKNLATLEEEMGKKYVELQEVMPKVVKYKEVGKPAKPLKIDGTLSEAGKKWITLLRENALPVDYEGTVKVIASINLPNAGSTAQVKEWLYSLGWKPETFEARKSKKGVVKRVPQINTKDAGICPSVKKLIELYPYLSPLEGIGILSHRIGLLKGFLETERDGYVVAHVGGFTNTMRFKHKVLTNLPQIPKPYWEEVRGCLIAPEGMILCGSDMSGLEDNTKQHYMYFYDPEYVIEMRTPGFDAHIDIAILAKAMSWDEGEFYKWYDKEGNYSYIPYKGDTMLNNTTGKSFQELISLPPAEQKHIAKEVLKPIRLKNKKVNFAAVYGAFPPKLAETAGVSIKEGKILFDVYWTRNKSVNQVAKDCIVKTVGEQMWLWNPVSGFWYTLRFDKDRFSTLNQSTGVYCFDTWNRHVRSYGIKLCGQFHDEIIFPLRPENKERAEKVLLEAIEKTNQELQLNVPLKVSVDFGLNYSQIH